MKNPAAALNLRHCSRTSTELLSLLLFCLLLSLSFSIHPVRSKSDTSNREEPVQWQILTKHNFSSQIRLNPHILLIVTVPWSGESRSLMKELAHMVNKKKEVFRTLKLMFVHKNHDKMLADALGATMEINIICYRHSLPYKYQGTLWIQSILSSARYLMSLLPEEIPLKSLPTADDLTTFLKSTDKALLVLEFCGWTPKLMAKVMNNGSENAFGVPLGAGLYGVNSEPNSADGIKNQGKENEKISCDVDNEFNQLPGLNEFAPVNESDFMESEKLRSNDGATCSFEEFQLFESSLYNFTTSVRDFFLPPERLKFGLVSERSLISSLGVADTSSWLMMLYTSGCPTCAKVFKEGSDLKRIIEINASPVMELKGNEYDFDPGLPSDKPSVLLFIDRSSDSSKTRTKSKESLTIFRELASHNHAQNIINPHNPFIVSQHPKLEMSTSSQQLTSLKDKIHIMAMKAGKHITFDDIVSNLQGSSFQEVLTQVLQKKKQTKLSSLAKDVGFQLLSDDIDITIPETNPQSDDHKDDNKDVDLTGFNCSFFFIDGKFRLLENLSGVLKIPSLVIIDPLSNQHYVYPKEDGFSYSSLSNFLYEFLNGSLVPYQRSRFVVSDSKVAPHPPFVNQDFHEVDSIPRVSALSFMELVVGNQSGYLDSVWKKDVLVLFTSSWCGFCLRTELVVREVYQSFKGYGNMVNTQFKNQQSSSRNDDLNDTILKLPLIYMLDCTENDCSSLLKSSTKRDLYPSLVLYPAESKEAITYDGETSVLNIIKFIADQGGNSHWIYKERGILWTEAEQVTWNEKPFTDDISLKNENNEILLKDRIGTHKSDTKNNIVPIYDSSHLLHEILPGSILVATQKLHSIYPFSKSKILIVKVNTTTGFQGLIINKQISWDSITQLDEGLDSLKEAPLSYGGPVIAREMPLVSLTRESSGNEDYPEVLPDIYFLDQLATINLIQNLKLHNRSMTDYWFFVGYSSWGWDQLFDEIADGSWNIVDGTEHKFDWPMT